MKSLGLLICSLNSGGAERVVSHLSHILSDEYDVKVILFENTFMEYECSGEVLSLDVPSKQGSLFAKIGMFLKRRKALKKFIKEKKIECIISFLDSPNFVNVFSGVKGCKKIVSVRNYDVAKDKKTFFNRIKFFGKGLMYKRADHIVPVSRLIAEDIKTTYHISKQKITPIYNPYNFDNIRIKGEENLSEQELNFYSDGFVFVNVGRIMYQKGIWHLIKAFSTVCKKQTNARLVLVGEDFTSGKLHALIDKLGLKERVLLVGRSRNPYKYLKKAQCYVLSSLFEGFPNSMAEAMACGLPIIATDCKSGPREILFDIADLSTSATDIVFADYGILIPALEGEESWDELNYTLGEDKMAFAMLELMNDESKRSKYAQLALQRSTSFDFETCKKKFLSVIES